MDKFLSRLTFMVAIEKLVPGLSRVSPEKRGNFLQTQVLPKRKIVVYTEKHANGTIKHQLDLASPRAALAAAELGLTYNDCVTK